MIKIGVSACLIGQKVRYDGKHKNANLEQYFDSDKYQLVPICPEVEMGLSVPRPSIQMRIIDDETRLVQVDNHDLDFTKQLKEWFNQNTQLQQIQGYILKSKSPSCGYQTTPHFNQDESELKNGLFVDLIVQQDRTIPILDENTINNVKALNHFKNSLKLHY